MKNLPILLCLFSSLSFFGQNSSQQLIEQTAHKIGIEKSDINSSLATFQKFEDEILVVIPEVAEKGNGYILFNSHIILINDESGAIKATFRADKDWYIDAVRLDKIVIEPKPYYLNKTTVAYGLQIFYSGQSRPNPYYSTHFSLYALQGSTLNRVLKDYPIKRFNGETDTDCKGTFEEHSKKMRISDDQTNHYADLEFTNQIELSKLDEDCEQITVETKIKTERLKFKNGKYTSGL